MITSTQYYGNSDRMTYTMVVRSTWRTAKDLVEKEKKKMKLLQHASRQSSKASFQGLAGAIKTIAASDSSQRGKHEMDSFKLIATKI